MASLSFEAILSDSLFRFNLLVLLAFCLLVREDELLDDPCGALAPALLHCAPVKLAQLGARFLVDAVADLKWILDLYLTHAAVRALKLAEDFLDLLARELKVKAAIPELFVRGEQRDNRWTAIAVLEDIIQCESKDVDLATQ